MLRTITRLFIITNLLIACKVTPRPTNQEPDLNQQTISYTQTEAFRKGIVTPANYTDTTGDTLTILSWNLEHFIDRYDNPYVKNKKENNAEGMQERIKLLIQALKKADADIVVLQEFESVQFLQKIATESLSDMGYTFFADHESINWYMNVVVMSRVPLGIVYGYGTVTTPVKYIDDETSELKYETQSHINTRMWSVDVLVNENYSFLLTGVHLKAGRGNRNEAMRLGQLKFLKGQFERFYSENPQKNMLIVGDFNCTPDSKEFQYLLDGNSPVKFIDNLTENIFSHPADNPKWRIDHILPNEAMQRELLNSSMEVKYFFDKQTQRKLADHLPLVAKFSTIEKINE